MIRCPYLIPRLRSARVSHIVSTILAYWVTDNTPTCRMFWLRVIACVSPYFVLIWAVMLVLKSLINRHILPWIPFCHRTYMIPSSHTLS